ncbi:MAG TPA: hypothetical protein VJZ25_07085 [Gemmatimonadaceae bacterium]|nr:hypothetical protein [Gemmatimonadaceae bacterium]
MKFVRDNFKIEPDKWQIAALRAFSSTDARDQRIAMKACKGPGKTAVLAWMIWNFLSCFGSVGEHPKGKATGITEQNLDDNLWPELSKWQKRSPYLTHAFTWSKSRIFANEHPETWFFAKQAWPKSGNPQEQANTLAGLHGKFVLFVMDESGGIPTPVSATAEAGLANADLEGAWAKLVQAGNPTHLEGPLYDACTVHSHLWALIEITGDPDDPDRSPRISKVWARQQIDMYGADNPWVLVNVFGKFPPSSLNALLGPDEVRAAMHRHLRDDDYSFAQKRLGVDVARFGDDRTVIARRQGLCASFPFDIMRGERTTSIAARVLYTKREWGSEMELIDDTGHWGHGVIDNLLAAGLSPIGVQFHAPALNPRYRNRRAEGWLEMADWVKRGGALPDVPELVAELTTPTYTFANGKFILEEKDQIKERLGRSPDLADALALTFMLPELPASDVVRARIGFVSTRVDGFTGNVVEHDYDPLAEVTS